MQYLTAVSVGGFEAPLGLLVAVVLLFILFLVMNRNNGLGLSSQAQGVGTIEQCPQCGRDFQPEKVEHFPNGEQREVRDEHCPGCNYQLSKREQHPI